MAKGKTTKKTGARIHIRARSTAQLVAFHAYAARRGTNLSKLVVAYLQHLLELESQASRDAEQI